MGHTRLVRLPGTRKWSAVVGLLESGAPDATVLSATATAAERDLAAAARNPVFVEAVRLLCQIPMAARSDNFAASLRHEGLDAGAAPGLLDIVMAASQKLDEARAGMRSADDFAELSARALVSTISDTFGSALPGLLDPDPEHLRIEVRKFATPEGFQRLSRTFFDKLLDATLRYWLDRALPKQTGEGRRFRTMGDRGAFDAAMSQYVSEATRIIKEFSRGWYAKVAVSGQSVPSDRAAAFGHVAFKKIGEELRRKCDADD